LFTSTSICPKRSSAWRAASTICLGSVCVFATHVRPHFADGSLLCVIEDWCQPIPGFFLYYPSRRQMPAGLRAFIDLAREAGEAGDPT
jgi:DNA-binding transcriptional LysR family regulator